MKFLIPDGYQLPTEKEAKLRKVMAEVQSIVEEAEKLRITQLDGRISFTFQTSVQRDVLTDFERAQSAAFYVRYEHLPEMDEVRFVEREGNLYLESVHSLRSAFNEYRPIFMNQGDSSYYAKVHKTVHQKLLNFDTQADLQIVVTHEMEGNVSAKFASILKERAKSIRKVIELSDFKYIYNGILQHSAPEFTERLQSDNITGELNYVFIKNVSLLPYLKDALWWHYRILGTITFPKLGPL